MGRGKKDHASGKKVGRSHSTIIDAARVIIETANRQAEVHNISLGHIVMKLHPGQIRYKIKPISGGLKVTVRGPTSKQIIIVYSRVPDVTLAALTAATTR